MHAHGCSKKTLYNLWNSMDMIKKLVIEQLLFSNYIH